MRRMCSFALAALLGAAPALAQPSAQPATTTDVFTLTDRNGDGEIDHQEYADREVDVFFFADGDKDGKLSAAEVGASDAAFKAADRNGDGALSLAEFQE